jgi:hypothetical protein
MEKTLGVVDEQRAVWFDELISTLRLHELQLDTGTMPAQMKKVYEVMISGNFDEMFRLNKAAAQEFFVKKIIIEYLSIIGDHLPNKLAFDFNDSEVLVWAEITDNDQAMEDLLTKAEAKINAKFHPYGFDMESMIVECGDKLPVPNHYKTYK